MGHTHFINIGEKKKDSAWVLLPIFRTGIKFSTEIPAGTLQKKRKRTQLIQKHDFRNQLYELYHYKKPAP